MNTTNTAHEVLPPHARAWAPGARSIADPIPLGEQADQSPIGLALWTKAHGQKHPLMGGASGSGKTNTLNVLTAGLAGCGDTVIWAIEVAKAGQGQAAWLPCIDWLATTPAEAVDMLRAAVAIIDIRSRALAAQAAHGKGADKVVPARHLPALIIIIDECAALHGIMSGSAEAVELAAEATELARRIAQTGRSAAVGLIPATQRPTVAALGNDGDYRSQLHPNLCLRMNRRADVGFVLQGVDLDTVDTTLFNVPGLLYVQDGPDVDPLPVRSYALYDPGIVYRLARVLAPGRPPLDPDSRDAAGEPYALRPADPFTAPAARPARKPRPRPMPDTATDAASTSAASDRKADRTARARATDSLAAARATLADTEALPELPDIPLADLPPAGPANEQPTEQPSDPTIRDAILAALNDGGASGMTMREITKKVDAIRGGAHRASVHRELRALTDTGHVRQSGAKGRYRYHLNTAQTMIQDDAA
jgi:hypothetical protein